MNIVTTVKNWFQPKPKPRPKLGPNEQYVDETDSGKLYIRLFKEGCPDCGNEPHWYAGPSGGMSQNIFCGYCGQGYNVTPVVGIAEKIHKDEKYADRKTIT